MFFFIFRSTIFDNFDLTHKKEEVWPNGTHPMLFAESICVCMPTFYACNSILFFVAKVPFLVIFLIQKKVWPYRYAYDVPLMTLIGPSCVCMPKF